MIILDSMIYDIITFSETWLTHKIEDFSISHNNYTIYRQDRSSKGGGVCIFVKKLIVVKEVQAKSINGADILILDIFTNIRAYTRLIAIYIPPKVAIVTKNLSNILDSLDFYLCHPDPLFIEDIVIVGDFNLPSIDWALINKNPSLQMNTGNALIDFIEARNLK